MSQTRLPLRRGAYLEDGTEESRNENHGFSASLCMQIYYYALYPPCNAASSRLNTR